MIKKAIALAGAASILLSVASPTFGWGGWWRRSRDVAIVDNGAVAETNTGGNTQDNWAEGNDASVEDNSGDRYMSTGSADAYAGALVVANTHVDCCEPDPCEPCIEGGGWGYHRRCPCPHTDYADVSNGALADANSGVNAQDDGASGDGEDSEVEDNSGHRTMYTDPASSTARAWTIVNTHWSW